MDAHKASFLRRVMQTNNNYGLSEYVRLLDARANALTVLNVVELQAPSYFASHLVVRAGGFSEANTPSALVASAGT